VPTTDRQKELFSISILYVVISIEINQNK